MSQLVTKQNLIELEETPVLDLKNVINTSALIKETAREIVTAGISITNFTEDRFSVKSKVKKNPVLTSPIELKKSFKEFYTRQIDNAKITDTLIVRKTAVIKTLKELDYKIEDKKVVRDMVGAVLNTSTVKEFSGKVEELMEEIQHQHTGFLIKNTASIIREASIKVDFVEEVRITSDNEKTFIVAHQNGKALLTEIKLDKKTNRIDMATETIGFEGESCDLVMKAFQDELARKGLKFSTQNKKRTGGNCWLPSSRSVQRKLKSKGPQKRNEERRRENLKRNNNLSSKLKHKNYETNRNNF